MESSFKYAHRSGIVDFGKSPDVAAFGSLISWRCPRRVLSHANQLLLQAEPKRTALLSAAPSAVEGEVHFVRKDYQVDEFNYVLNAVAAKLKCSNPAQILILAPRRKLGHDFAESAETHKRAVGISDEVHFRFTAKHEFNDSEKVAILKFGLLAKPDSIIHQRSYLGLGDSNHFAPEFRILKDKYGSLRNAFEQAAAEDFARNQRRVRGVCDNIQNLKQFVETNGGSDIDTVLGLVFPETDVNVADVRSILTYCEKTKIR